MEGKLELVGVIGVLLCCQLCDVLIPPMELNVSEETILVNNKLTASCPTNMYPKYYIKCYKQQK